MNLSLVSFSIFFLRLDFLSLDSFSICLAKIISKELSWFIYLFAPSLLDTLTLFPSSLHFYQFAPYPNSTIPYLSQYFYFMYLYWFWKRFLNLLALRFTCRLLICITFWSTKFKFLWLFLLWNDWITYFWFSNSSKFENIHEY